MDMGEEPMPGDSGMVVPIERDGSVRKPVVINISKVIGGSKVRRCRAAGVKVVKDSMKKHGWIKVIP